MFQLQVSLIILMNPWIALEKLLKVRQIKLVQELLDNLMVGMVTLNLILRTVKYGNNQGMEF